MSFQDLTPIMIGRVFKEIKRYNLNAELIDNELFILLDLNKTIKKILEINKTSIFLKLNLKDYPWKCPSINFIISDIFLNNKEEKLNKIYRTNKMFSKELKNISGIDCLHCSSYLCDGKWTPTTTIAIFVSSPINLARD